MGVELTAETQEPGGTGVRPICGYCSGSITDRRYFRVVRDGEAGCYHEGCWHTMATPESRPPA